MTTKKRVAIKDQPLAPPEWVVTPEELRHLQAAYSLDMIEAEDKLRGNVSIDLGSGQRQYVSVRSEPGVSQICYEIVTPEEWAKRYPLDTPWLYSAIAALRGAPKKRAFMDAKAERPEGFFHGMKAMSRRRVWILVGPPVTAMTHTASTADPVPLEPETPREGLERQQKAREKTGTTDKAAIVPIRPLDLSNIENLDGATAMDMLEKIVEAVRQNLYGGPGVTAKGRALLEAYRAAAINHADGSDENDKKFRYSFAMPGSIQRNEKGIVLIDVKLQFKVSDGTECCLEAGVKQAAAKAPFFDRTTGEATQEQPNSDDDDDPNPMGLESEDEDLAGAPEDDADE